MCECTAVHYPNSNAVAFPCATVVAIPVGDSVAGYASCGAHGTGSRGHAEPGHRPAAGSRAASTIDRCYRNAAARKGVPPFLRGSHRMDVGAAEAEGRCSRPEMVAGRSVERSDKRFRRG